MSKYMLCDDATINDVNPFVVHDFSLPGGVRQTPEFADYTKEVNTKSDIEHPKLSPICEIARTAGDKTIDFCTGGREPPCPLGRAVHPKRNIDYGWTRQEERVKIEEMIKANDVKTRNGMVGFIIFIILVALVVSIVRR
jgi:hypothetical protein